MNRPIGKIILFMGLIIFPLILFAQDESTQLFYSAKRLMHQRKYDRALENYELLKKKFPDSKYNDDAEFWSAYIWEKKADDKKAFESYEKFVSKNPTSPFVDDAMVYQISVAEKLARKGDKNFREFIVTKLSSPNKTVKYQASLSLGKLRDARAIPTLTQIANNGDQDMSLMAKSLIHDINKPMKNDDDALKRMIKSGQNRDSDSGTNKTIERNKVPFPGSVSSPKRQPETKNSKPPATKQPPKRSSTTKKKLN